MSLGANMKITISNILIGIAFVSLIGCGTTPTNKKNLSEYSLDKIQINADSDSNEAGALETVYFPFNSSDLRENAQQSLGTNAEFLKKFKSLKVQVEGHCDERGSVQYNLALGEKRAQSIKDYLVASGVESNRITTITFGKERPLSLNHDEVAWSKNRRGNFVIIAK